MDFNFLGMLLNDRLDELSRTHMFNGTKAVIQRYKDVQRLIKACGHDTRELDQAIIEAHEALVKLDYVQEQTKTRFKANGICFVADESKRQELEQEKLT